MFNTIRSRINLSLILMAVVPLLIISLIFSWYGLTTAQEQAIISQGETAQRIAVQVETFINGLERELQVVEKTHGLSNLEPERQTVVLSQLLSQQPAFDELALLNQTGQETIRLNRFRAVSDTQLTSRAQQDEFIIPTSTGQTHYSSIYFSAETGEPLITIALPLFNLRTAEIEQVLVAEVRFRHVWNLLAALPFEQKTAYIIDAENRVIAHPNPSVVLRGTFAASTVDGIVEGLTQPEQMVLASYQISLGDQPFTVLVEQPLAAVQATNYSIILSVLLIMAVLFVVALSFSRLASNMIVRPLQELTAVTQQIEAGNLTVRAPEETLGEVKVLSRAINSMTEQLQQTVQVMETNVKERTRALQASIDVGRHLSTLLNQDELVNAVVTEVQAAFNYYHVHIYLYDENSQQLVLTGGTGDLARKMLAQKHRLPLGQGLVGKAAATKMAVLAPNVRQDPNWLPNPLLAETEAEVAVPIILGTAVLGVLDVQQNQVNSLSETDSNLLQSIANQMAAALNNARIYRQTQRQAEREMLINKISQQIQYATTVEAVLQIAAEELGQAVAAEQASIHLQSYELAENGRIRQD